MITKILSLFKGLAIGVAEILPGISGGTIAFIIGIYETIIDSIHRVVKSAKVLLLGGFNARVRAEAAELLRGLQWGVIIPAALGMVSGILLGAALIAPIYEAHPVLSTAFFAGLIIASIWVPVRMVGSGWNWKLVVLVLLGAATGFAYGSLPITPAMDDVALWYVFIAAALAICALALPGLSGSFLLILLGVYAPTLAAVNSRDWVFIGVFMLGALFGMATFVSVLQWLLREHRNVTLAVMTGLLIGTLRALWPWKDAAGNPLEPATNWPEVLLLVFAGIVVIIAMFVFESYFKARTRLRELEQQQVSSGA